MTHDDDFDAALKEFTHTQCEHEPNMIEVLFVYLIPVTLISAAIMIVVFALLVLE